MNNIKGKENNNVFYYLGFSHFLGIGPYRFNLLIDKFKNVKKAYCANKSDLEKVISADLVDRFIKFRNRFDLLKKYKDILKKDIKIITRENVSYPKQLFNISDPPICLYVKGNIKSYDFEKDIFLSIVGTRKPTEYGRKVAKRLSLDLSKAGFTIISGMALGIDAQVHSSVLNNKGKTIAVLGCGVDVVYPLENRDLYFRILNENGLIVSEFPPGVSVKKGMFTARNRIISGMSNGVLIIEGTKRSGTLITARYALLQGREVFVVPSPITEIQSEAPNILLKQGAKLVACCQDILEEF